MTINAVGLLGLFLLSVAIASEKDPPPTSSEKLKLWRSVKKLVEHDPPAIATQSGDRQEHEDGGGDLSKSADGAGGVAIPTHLSRVDSDADTAGQHGLEHPAVVVDVPVLECECTEYSPVAWSTEYSHVASSACREGGQVDFNVSVRGLFPGFEYEFEITWTLEGDKLTHIWKSVVTANTDSHTLREPLVQRGDNFNFGILAWETYNKGNDHFLIVVTVRDMYPGLTREEALIGIRNIDSFRAPVRLSCIKFVQGASSEAVSAGIHTARPYHQNDVGTVPTYPHADSDADTAGQHGLDHPAVVVDLSELECTVSRVSKSRPNSTLAAQEGLNEVTYPPLLTGNVSSDFKSFGAEWGFALLLREILTEISYNHPTVRQKIIHTSMCYESEHSLVLPGGRDMSADTPVGKVVSIFNTNETYRVRMVSCDLNKYDIVVQYSMANVRNFEVSGVFPLSLLSKIVYVPSIEYLDAPVHRREILGPITTFIDVNQPRRRELIERLRKHGIQSVNHNTVNGRASMMVLYDSIAVMINVHQTPHHHTLEEFRVLPALLRGVVVVCENSPLTDAIPYSEFVVWSSIEDMPSTVQEVMGNYDTYFNRIFGKQSELPLVLARMRHIAYTDMEKRMLALHK